MKKEDKVKLQLEKWQHKCDHALKVGQMNADAGADDLWISHLFIENKGRGRYFIRHLDVQNGQLHFQWMSNKAGAYIAEEIRKYATEKRAKELEKKDEVRGKQADIMILDDASYMDTDND